MAQLPKFIKEPDNHDANPPSPDMSQAVLNVVSKPEPSCGTNSNRNKRTPDEQEIQRIKSENSVRKLPRKANIEGSAFYISYGCLIYSGKYSIHHVVRASDKRLFSLKIDDRDPAMIFRDEKARSKLVGVDLPTIIHSERRRSVTFIVMEPLSMTLKSLIQGFSMKKENRQFNSAILLRIGRMCIRLLKKLHDNGILHGNINPHTFILRCDHEGQDAKPDLKRGPIIVDFSHAIDSNEDILYKEETPETRFSSAIYPEDGGLYTKRDDMENLGYLLLFLANGHISWDVRKRRDHLLFGKKCLSELHRYLKGIPLVIKNYLTYVRTIKWNASPDYELLDLCLVSKNLDIRTEIKTRRERLRFNRKRKRGPPATSCSERTTIVGDVPRAFREQTSNTPKRHQVEMNRSIHYDSKATDVEPEYFQMSLQLFPNIAVKFSYPKVRNTNTIQMRGRRFALNKAEELDEGLNQATWDRFSQKPDKGDGQECFEEECFSIPGKHDPIPAIEDGIHASRSQAVTRQQDMLLASKRTGTQTHSLQTNTNNNIQFHFPFLLSDNEDELRHPWEEELGSIASRSQ